MEEKKMDGERDIYNKEDRECGGAAFNPSRKERGWQMSVSLKPA